jgi:hypothetical protein
MKQYPSIPKITKDNLPPGHFHCFDKIDGSSIRAEWNTKKGFYKFGTRHQLIDEKSVPFGKAIPMIRDKYERDLADIFRANKWQSVICFFELWGAESFAGNHNFDKPLDITLFDVNPYKHGIMVPQQFIEMFGHLDIPTICYEGIITSEVFDMIRQSKLEGMTFEGVVAKGEDNDRPVMFKIKSQAWLDKLKAHCGDDKDLFARLE